MMASGKDKTPSARSRTRDHAEKSSDQKSGSSRSSDLKSDAQSNQKSNRASGSKTTKMPYLEPGKSMRTTDHAVIRQWIEDRSGSPAAVKATESGGDPGLLRVNFPGYSGKYSLEDISWDDFFEKFDEKNLEFLFQDQTKAGKQSRFFKFVNQSGSGSSGKRNSSAAKSSSQSSSRSKEK